MDQLLKALLKSMDVEESPKLIKYLNLYTKPTFVNRTYGDFQNKISAILLSTNNLFYKRFLKNKNFNLTELKLIYSILKLSEITRKREPMKIIKVNDRNLEVCLGFNNFSYNSKEYEDDIIKLMFSLGEKMRFLRKITTEISSFGNNHKYENQGNSYIIDKYFKSWLCDRIDFLENRIFELNGFKKFPLSQFLKIKNSVEIIHEINFRFSKFKNLNSLEPIFSNFFNFEDLELIKEEDFLKESLNLKNLVENILKPYDIFLNNWLLNGEINENSFGFLEIENGDDTIKIIYDNIPYFITEAQVEKILEIGLLVRLLKSIGKLQNNFFDINNLSVNIKKVKKDQIFHISSENLSEKIKNYNIEIKKISNEEIIKPFVFYLNFIGDIFLMKRDDFYTNLLFNISKINSGSLSKRSLTQTVSETIERTLFINNYNKDFIKFVDDVDLVFRKQTEDLMIEEEHKLSSRILGIELSGKKENMQKSSKKQSYDYITLTISPSYPFNMFLKKNTVVLFARFFNLFFKLKRTEQRLISLKRKKPSIYVHNMLNLLMRTKNFLHSELFLGLEDCFELINEGVNISLLGEKIDIIIDGAFRKSGFYKIKKLINGIEEWCVNGDSEYFVYALDEINVPELSMFKNVF